MGRELDTTLGNAATAPEDADIAAVVRSFEDCSLPRPEWTHANHLVVALWYVLHHTPADAVTLMRDGIYRYANVHGSRTGYHETITLAWVAVIERFLKMRGRDQPVSVLAARLLAECGDKEYLLRFYSRERLFSDEARVRWVAPDLAEIECRLNRASPSVTT